MAEINEIEQLTDIIKNKSTLELINIIDNYHPHEISEVLSSLDEESRMYFYANSSNELISQILVHYETDFAGSELKRFKPKQVQIIINLMEQDDLVDILREIDETTQLKIISLLPKEDRITIKKLLSYDEDLIASSMNPDFIKVAPHIKASVASKELVNQAEDVENIDYIYVLDEENHLIGSFTLKTLLTTDKDVNIDEIIDEFNPVLHTTDKQEDAIFISQNYDLTAIPILNEEEQMVGIVTVDDIIDIVNEEVQEDFSKLAAINSETIDKDERTIDSVKKRIPWLLILLFIGIFTSSIISGFEETIANITLIAAFLPLVLDMAGNVGTQSLATTIRLLSSNQLDEKKDIRRHLFRELGIGALNAFAVSILVTIVVFAFSLIQAGWVIITVNVIKSIVIGLSMAVSLIVTNFVGALIPIIISRFKIDPATASGPFITTISDILSLLIYFGMATMIVLPLVGGA